MKNNILLTKAETLNASIIGLSDWIANQEAALYLIYDITPYAYENTC